MGIRQDNVGKAGLKGAIADKLDDLWEDVDAEELGELEPPTPQLTVPRPRVIKKLSNDYAEENLGMKVQPDGCNISTWRHSRIRLRRGRRR